MPKIGLTMTEGKIIEWKKREGERVEKGEFSLYLKRKKVAFEVEAPQSGFLVKILAQVDEIVPIGGVVGLLIEKEGEKVEVTPKKRRSSLRVERSEPRRSGLRDLKKLGRPLWPEGSQRSVASI